MGYSVLQFGEGNFIRAFFDWMLQKIGEKAGVEHRVFLVQPLPEGRVEDIVKQGEYHVLLRGYQDGEYREFLDTVTVIAGGANPFTPGGRQAMVEAALSPELRIITSNTTEAGIFFENRATVTGPVTLAYQFRQGAKATYTITGQTDIKELGANRYYEFVPWNLYSSYAGRFEVAAAETVTNTQAGQAVIERALTAGEVDLPEAISRLLGVGKTTQVNVTAAGALKDGPGVVNTECKFGAAWIALPEKPVQEGDKWSGPLVAQFEVQDGRTVAVTAEHQVVDFVKEHGVDCALIQSTYSQRGPLSVRIYGQVRELDSVFVEGQRKTYFAIKQGCVVRMEDTLRGEFTIKSGDFGMYTTGAAGPTIPGAPAPAGRSVPDTVNLQLLMSLTSDMDQ